MATILPVEAIVWSAGSSTHHAVEGRFLVPGLVPGDEGSAVPALVAVVSEYGVPVHEEGDAVVVSPAAPLFGQVENEGEVGRDGLAGCQFGRGDRR